MIQEAFPMTVGEEVVLSEHHLLAGVEDGPLMESAQSVKYLILHCSTTSCRRNYGVEQLMRDHKARGFRTIGYHFYIRRDGSVSQHRRLLEVGAHCRPFNRCSIGICYEGGIDERGQAADTRTPQQTEQLTLLLMKLLKLFPEASIRGHRDMPGATPKACPGFDAAEVFGYLEQH